MESESYRVMEVASTHGSMNKSLSWWASAKTQSKWISMQMVLGFHGCGRIMELLLSWVQAEIGCETHHPRLISDANPKPRPRSTQTLSLGQDQLKNPKKKKTTHTRPRPSTITLGRIFNRGEERVGWRKWENRERKKKQQQQLKKGWLEWTVT